MRLIGDYHLHTLYSGDCKTPVQDVLEAAVRLGLREIALTDHGPGNIAYGMNRASLWKLREDIDRLCVDYKDLKILLGIEANIHGRDGEIDVDDEMMSILDWVNAGYHFGSRPSTDGLIHARNMAFYHLPVTEEYKRKTIWANTQSVVNAIKNNKINMITHPGDKGDIDVLTVAKVAAEYGTLLEINAPHGKLSVEDLNIALSTDVKFCVCSDAHTAQRVGEVQKAFDRVKLAKVPLDRIYNVID